MPIRTYSAVDAYGKLGENQYHLWPRQDDPDNRFSHFADPSFKSSFLLEPGQQIFTIGSCFARNIERVLASRGFKIPTLEFASEENWGGDPQGILNNYVPAAIAPQIRWAFGFDKFDITKHGGEARPGRFVDLQLSSRAFRPMPAEIVIKRRERLGEMYRQLARSQTVIVTLGHIEAWYDTRSELYINAAPLKSLVDAEPERFKLHVLDYGDVIGALRELMALLDQVCPAGYRMILTVSPVPLTATFTSADVAVANSYSKSVLRAAVEELITERSRTDYFPSYESVVLTDRKLAWRDDQIHVSAELIQFNVDRMIRRYVDHSIPTPTEVVRRSRELRKEGRRAEALKFVQQEWSNNPTSSALAVELSELHLVTGAGAAAEKVLRSLLQHGEDPAIRLVLARHLNQAGRFEEAAVSAESAAEQGVGWRASLERVTAYYHLGRFEEGLAVLNDTRRRGNSREVILDWRARFLERLDRYDEAELCFRRCNAIIERPEYMLHFAQFLIARNRQTEAMEWLAKCLLVAPGEREALRLRAELSGERDTSSLRKPSDSIGLLRDISARIWTRVGLHMSWPVIRTRYSRLGSLPVEQNGQQQEPSAKR